MEVVTNFLRYPGSKRRQLTFLSNFLPAREEIENHYVEPFLGGGAVFFYISPFTANISDINADLIDLYKGIKVDPQSVWNHYLSFGQNKNEYHRIRDRFESEELSLRAARILYLNRTCFKGMWRYNSRGKFNVGYGGEERRWVINLDNLIEVSIALQRAHIQCVDFESIIQASEFGDYIFVDPPYRPGGIEQKNDHYSWKTFRYEDQRRLAHALMEASRRGAHWALSISSHPRILELYAGCWAVEFPLGTGNRLGIMTRKSGEVLIMNHQKQGAQLI